MSYSNMISHLNVNHNLNDNHNDTSSSCIEMVDHKFIFAFD